MSDLKALSLHQPWASLIAIGAKQIETRSWPTWYRGPIAIHATKSLPPYVAEAYAHTPAMWEPIQRIGGFNVLPLGAIVAVADLVDVFEIPHLTYGCPELPFALDRRELDFGDFTPGRYGWRLENVQPLREPIVCRGAQMLWFVPVDVVEKIRAQGVVL